MKTGPAARALTLQPISPGHLSVLTPDGLERQGPDVLNVKKASAGQLELILVAQG